MSVETKGAGGGAECTRPLCAIAMIKRQDITQSGLTVTRHASKLKVSEDSGHAGEDQATVDNVLRGRRPGARHETGAPRSLQ